MKFRKLHNRVKTVSFENDAFDVSEDYSYEGSEYNFCKSYKILNSSSLDFKVSEIIPGKKYTDTCIAELNFIWEKDYYDGPSVFSMFDWQMNR